MIKASSRYENVFHLVKTAYKSGNYRRKRQTNGPSLRLEMPKSHYGIKTLAVLYIDIVIA